jgi:hypothetical protein
MTGLNFAGFPQGRTIRPYSGADRRTGDPRLQMRSGAACDLIPDDQVHVGEHTTQARLALDAAGALLVQHERDLELGAVRPRGSSVAAEGWLVVD